MPDSSVLIPIVDGATITVQGIYNQTTLAGTVCVMPYLELWANGGTVGTGAPLPVFDVAALTNTGSIAASSAAIQTNTGSLIPLTGSIVTSNAAIQASASAIATSVAGTLITAPGGTPTALDVTTVTTAGTAVAALSAGHAAKGGFLYNPNAFTLYYAQIGTAGTVASGNTIPIPAGQSTGLLSSGNAVSVNSGTNSAIICGYGLV